MNDAIAGALVAVAVLTLWILTVVILIRKGRYILAMFAIFGLGPLWLPVALLARDKKAQARREVTDSMNLARMVQMMEQEKKEESP